MQQKCAKGCTAWYKMMSEKLEHHRAGMMAVNRIPKMKQAAFRSDNLEKLVTAFSKQFGSTSAESEEAEYHFREGAKAAKKLMVLSVEILIGIANKWLDGQYVDRWNTWMPEPIFASGGQPLHHKKEFVFSQNKRRDELFLQDLPGIPKTGPNPFNNEFYNAINNVPKP